MANDTKIALFPLTQWTEATKQHLNDMRHDEPIISGVEYYRELFEMGDILLYGLFNGDEQVASILCEVYEAAGIKELVILQACAGEGGKALLFTMFDVYDSMAKLLDCKHVSFDTTRPSVEAAAKQLGYKESSVKLRKAVSNGR